MIARRRLLEQITAGSLVAALPRASLGKAETPNLGSWDPNTFAANRLPPASAGLKEAEDAPTALQQVLVGFGVSKENPEREDWDLSLTSLAFDPDGVSLHRVPMPFFAHGVVQHPDHAEQVITFQKRGPGSAVVDLRKGVVLRTIETKPTHQFYGHGAFTRDGHLLATETDLANNFRGLIALRDGKTYQRLGEFPSFGPAPHECRLIDDDRVLAITNGGGPKALGGVPSVTFVDVATQRLLEKLEFDRKDMNAGHLMLSASGDLVVISSFLDGMEDVPDARGGISFRPAGGQFRTITEPRGLIEALYGETLSVAMHEPSNTFAVTTPQGNWLSFWDLTTGELKYAEQVPQPKGIVLTPDGSHFAVSYTYRGRALLSQWSTSTLARVPEKDLIDVYISGSHLVHLEVPA